MARIRDRHNSNKPAHPVEFIEHTIIRPPKEEKKAGPPWIVVVILASIVAMMYMNERQKPVARYEYREMPACMPQVDC